MQVLDARPPAEFANGSINGSKSFPIPKVVDMSNKTMKAPEERKAAYEGAGVDLNRDIVLTCQGAVAASVLYGSLKDITNGNLAVYDGAWNEFSKSRD